MHFGSACLLLYFIFDSVCAIFLLFFVTICVVSLPVKDFVLCTLKHCETPWETSFIHSARTFYFWCQKHPCFFFFFTSKEDKTGTSVATDKHSFYSAKHELLDQFKLENSLIKTTNYKACLSLSHYHFTLSLCTSISHSFIKLTGFFGLIDWLQ